MCAETYSYLGPRGRIHNIERDVEKERTEVIVKFKANVLGAQSTVALFGWDFKELRLGCSNKERRVVKQQYDERLSAAKVAWEAAKHDSKSAFRAAERACEAAAPRRLGRAGDEINGRSAKAGAQKKVALRHLKSSLRVAEKVYSAEVSLAKDEEKDGLSRVRQDVCKNWDGNQRRLELVLDNVVSSGHASVERMVSINKRLDRALTPSLGRHECSEDDIAEVMEEERQLCQDVLTDIRRMQLASSSGKSPPTPRMKKDTKTIQRGKAIADARGKLRILGRYGRDRDTTRGRCRRTFRGRSPRWWSSKSGAKGKGGGSHPSQGPAHSHSPCCDCCYCFCARRLEGIDRGQELAMPSQLAIARSYFANAAILTKVERHAPDASSLCFLLLAVSLVCRSVSSLPAMLENKRSRRLAALPSCESVTLETICMGLVFLAALPQGALSLPSAKRLTLESTTSDAIAAVKAKTEADPEFDALSSNSGANHVEWDEVVHDNWRLGGGGDKGEETEEENDQCVCGDQPMTSPLFHKLGMRRQEKDFDWLQPQAEVAHGPYRSSLFYDEDETQTGSYGLCPEQACLHDDEGCSKEVTEVHRGSLSPVPVPVMPQLLGGAEKRKTPLTRSAERKRNSRARMTEEQKEEAKDKNAEAKRKSGTCVGKWSSARRTPEEVAEAENKAKEGARRSMRAKKAVELAQGHDFAKIKMWEVPGRDCKFKHFADNPELSVLLFYANNGSWRDRASRMLVAWLHVCNKLICEMDDAKDAAGAKQAERKLRGLCTLSRERLEDRASLLQVVHEHIRGDDWSLLEDWKGEQAINGFETAQLEWLVTKGLECGEDCKLLREKRKQRPPLVDSWARSLIGLKLKVPGGWWDNWPAVHNRTPYDCEIVDVDYKVREAEVEEENDERYFVIQCEYDNRRYPMEYKHVWKYSRRVEQKGQFDVQVKPYKNVIDERFDKLCIDTLEDLESCHRGGLNWLLSDVKKHRQSIINEMSDILDSQRVEPGKQRELGEKFLKAQGRGTVSWGKAKMHSDADLTSVDAPLLTCASCGFRRPHSSLYSLSDGNEGCFRVENRDVRSLDWAELDEAQRSEHFERMAKPVLTIPKNDKGGPDDFRGVETWKAYSRWPDKKPDELTNDTTLPDWMFCKNGDGVTDRSNPKYFHLHPEFVEEFIGDDGRRDFRARLCPFCCKFKPNGKRKAPARSVASGVDFGSPRRLGLVQLTPRERQMISKVRHYSNAIKIESNTGRQRELSHSAIKGHSILFDHDCPRVLKKLLSEENINDSIDVHFVGPEGQYDHLAKKALGSAHVSARPFAVYQWLKVLKEVNEVYSEDGELEEFPVVVERIEKCNKALVEEAVMVTADKKTSRETDIGRDDIREVRVSSGRNQAPAASNVEEVSIQLSLDIQCLADAKCLYPLQIGWVPPHSFLVNAFHLQCDLLLCLFRFGQSADEEDANGDVFPMHCSYLTSPRKTAHGTSTDDTHDLFVSVAGELGVNVNSEKRVYNESKENAVTESMSYREQDPLNEFVGGPLGKDEGLVKAFPDVFFLGKAYDNDRPSLSEEQTRHLLMQFTTNAASCQPLLFYLFDQIQRHGSIKGMYAKQVQNKSEFAKFADEYVSETFQEKLKEAVKDPHGKTGKEVMKKVEPILAGGGKLTIYGALARADTGGKIMAMRRRYACAPAFLTFAIDDVNHPTSIRLAMSSSSNTDFPAVVSGGHHEAMKHGFKFSCGEDEVSIPASYSARLRTLVNNPVGAAWVYQQLVIDVMSILVGKRPGFGQRSGITRTTEFTPWDEQNLGIAGLPVAFLGVNETTGGGSLHFHVVLWGGLSPDILELVADVPELCRHVGSVLDSIYSATLPREVHVRDLVTKDLKQNCDTSPTFKRRDAAASAMQVPPDPDEARDEFHDFTYCTVCGRNIHVHSHTCYKPPSGYHGCRMCRPAGDSDGTGPIELFWCEESQKPEKKEAVESGGSMPENAKHDFSPLTSPDVRTISWELNRPDIAGLPALGCATNEAQAKAVILSKLSEAMWANTRIENAVSFECVEDGTGGHEGAYEEVPNKEDAELRATFLNPNNCRRPSGSGGDWMERPSGGEWMEPVEDHECSPKNSHDSKDVDVHTFFDDRDRLFHGMLKGLVLAGVAPAHTKSVKDLRMELMDWVTKHQDEKYKGRRFALHLCDSGGEMDLLLLSKAKGVNVCLYTEDESSGYFLFKEVFEAGKGAEIAPTIYFVKRSADDCYSLFVPKVDAITRELQSLNVDQLTALYYRVAKKLNDRNGWVVEYNPLLTALLGCNTNLSFLGSKEQSKQALFYIGPYINKNGVKVLDALPLLAHAQNHALQYPSSADDAGTDTRLVQHIMTRVLNKLNSLMEVSDTQAALALLGMGPTVCSDIFAYYDLRSTKNFVLDQYFGNYSTLADINIALDGTDDADWVGDEDSFAAGSVYGSSDDESETENDGDECEKDFFDDEGNDGSDDEIETESDDGKCIEDFFEEESSDDDSIAEPVQFKESPIAVPLNYIPGEYGRGKIIMPKNTNVLHSIPYPVFYRYRGEALKDLNRLEYYSLVQVTRRDKENEGKRSRPKTKEFPFGCGLNEAIGGDGRGRYFQYLRSKQCTPQFFSSPPRHPGLKPSDPKQQMAWRMAADRFACDYLIMFRPEPSLCKEGESCTYDYNWEAFEDYVLQLQVSDKHIDRSRLEQIERMVHSWGVDEGKKNVLSEWRGRRRTMWSAEDKELASAEYRKFKKRKFGDEDDGEIDCGGLGGPSEQLTSRETKVATNMISHSNELLSELKRLHRSQGPGDKGTEGLSEPLRIAPFDADFAKSLRKLQPKDDDDNGRSAGSEPQRVPGSAEAKVDTYLEEEDLSSDKAPVIDTMREHYRAVCDGRSRHKKYDAPLLLVCGGPGNGKSKLVETLDDIALLMNAGTQVKTAFLGVAAVNIGGSSMCSLFDVPTERRNREGGPDIKKVILPWSEEKKKKFISTYDIEKISCIVVDEISTLKPYMLAYLSARLMELLPESGKDFGGFAVILCGDFDQLPPVGSDNLAAATMKYEERQDGSITRWDQNKHCVNVHNEGLRLMQKASCYQLTQQHRSKDPAHTEILNKMRTTGKVEIEDLKKCKLLKSEDVEGDGDFRFATTLVTGNEERHKINHLKAKEWASHRNTRLVRWLRKVDYRKWKGKPSSKELIKQAIATNECFYELFVPGARAFLTQNINTSIGLANGTEIKYHSISFDDRDKAREYRRHTKSHQPGGVITLDNPPSAVNVELFADFPEDSEAQKKKNAKMRQRWQHGSLVKDGGRIVIPISTSCGSYNEWEKSYVPSAHSTSPYTFAGVSMRRRLCSRPIYGLSTVTLKDHFCIEPGFCITLHKAQGRTIRRLILSISDHPYHKLRHEWEGLYVGLSRVEYNEHIRLLLKRGDWGTAKLLLGLERCKYTECFFKGYVQQTNQRGMRWNRLLARAAARETNLFKEKMKKTKAKMRVKKR